MGNTIDILSRSHYFPKACGEKKEKFIFLNGNVYILRSRCESFAKDGYVNSEGWHSSFSNRKLSIFFFNPENPCVDFRSAVHFVSDAGCRRPDGPNPAYSRLHSQASVSQKAIAWLGTWRPYVSQCFTCFLSKKFTKTWWSDSILNWLIACFPFLALTTSHCSRAWSCWKSSVRSSRQLHSWNTMLLPRHK